MIRDTYCDAEMSSATKLSGKSVVLNRSKWNKILDNLHRGEKEQEMSEKERLYKEYLKEESHAMTKKWEDSVEKNRERKNEERIKREQAKVAEGEMRFKKLRENDENKRLELVNEAKLSMQKSKYGARQLDSAYALSEIVQCRELQCAQRAKEAQCQAEREAAIGQEHSGQIDQWNHDDLNKIVEAKKRKDVYKKQLLGHINENEFKQKESTKRANDQIRQEREAADRDLQMQLERERIVLQKKKEAMRKNALEAMRIAEQRRLRVKMESEIEDKIISVFAKKTNAQAVKEENDIKFAKEKERLRHMIAQKIIDEAEAKQKAEQEQHEKDVQENEIKFSKIEQSKIDHCKKMKAARIQQHIDDLERKKKFEQGERELHQFELTNRFKNDEVNIDYDRQKRLTDIKRVQGHRVALQHQIDEKRQYVRPEYENEVDAVAIEDDQHFFKYANELIEETKAKQRPVYPLIKVVEAYRKTNNLDRQKDLLPHLKSNVDIKYNIESPIKYNIKELKKMNVIHSGPKRCSAAAALRLKNNNYNRFNNYCK